MKLDHPTGIILSAFFYGYLVLQIPGGWLSLRIGAKRVLGYSILIASAIHTSLPIIARYNCTLFVVARVIQGLALVRSLDYYYYIIMCLFHRSVLISWFICHDSGPHPVVFGILTSLLSLIFTLYPILYVLFSLLNNNNNNNIIIIIIIIIYI